ncbi:MAG TPA: LCP family protein [Phototrophicaceae bacterium]|nr:LCP family protein [Phototrophicaceae bacterium]
MFDFQSDHDDSRFMPPGRQNTSKGQPVQPPETRVAPQSPVVAPQNPVVTRQNTPPVSSIPAPIPSAIPMPPPAPPARKAVQQRPVPARRRIEWVLPLAALALIVIFSIVGIGLALLINASKSSAAVSTPTPIVALPTPVDARGAGDGVDGAQATAAVTDSALATDAVINGGPITLDDGSTVILQPWNGTSRLNLLLMGIDRRPTDTGLAFRSDTMMLISFDPVSKQLGILSIPRDLYVPIPGYSEHQRINTALPLGEQQRAGFGPKLAMQTVQLNLGMPVNAYVVVDFIAVTRLVDAIGGIDIDVPEPIADYQFPDMNYGYSPLILQAGEQHMDGNTAQKYARTRQGDSDFDRARRQQQVLYAIRDRLLNLNTLPQLIVQAPSLYASISNDVYTDLTIDQIIQLGLWLKDLPSSAIHTGVIDEHYTQNYTTPDGAEVLIPYQGALPTIMTQVFGSDYAQQ